MRNFKKLTCLLSWFLLVWGLPGQANSETLDRIVAVVNNDIILYGDLQDQIKLMEKVSPQVSAVGPSQRPQLEREVLEGMIQQKLAEQEIKRLKINVTQSEVNTAIDDIKRDNNFTDAQLEYVLNQEGQSLTGFREKIRQQLERARLIDRVVKSKIVITEDQVNQKLKSYTARSDVKERRRLAVIFLAMPQQSNAAKRAEAEQLADKIHKDLKAGSDFAKLARQYSQGPAAQEGGDIGYLASGELAPPIEEATKRLGKGDFTDVIKTPNGFYILKIIDIESESVPGDETNLREKVRKQLYQEEIDRKYQEWITDLKQKAFIQVNL